MLLPGEVSAVRPSVGSQGRNRKSNQGCDVDLPWYGGMEEWLHGSEVLQSIIHSIPTLVCLHPSPGWMAAIPPYQQRDGLPHFQGCDVYQVATKWRPEGHPGRRRNPGGPQRHGSEVLQSIPGRATWSVGHPGRSHKVSPGPSPPTGEDELR